MSKKRILLILILSLGSTGVLQANPLDSPGIVYIDGQPCNSACQSYMAWSAEALSRRYREHHETNVAAPEIERPAQAGPARAARQPARSSRATPPRAPVAASKTGTSNTRKAATPNAAAGRKDVQAAAAAAAKPISRSVAQDSKPESTGKPEPSQTAAVAPPQSVEAPKETVTPEVVLPPPATLEIAAPAKPATATGSEAPTAAARTIQQQVVEATGMADLVTAIGTGQAPAEKPGNPETASSETKDAGKAAAASDEKADNLVALVLARPEINSLSDLNNRNIAIEERQSASSGRVSAAFMAAGAAEVQFSEGQQGAVDRLIRGEVPAAVLTLASPQAAEWFPDIAGFRTFRVPLAQKARL
ncbi:hypothetical protein [Bradyrhizobium sp. CB3481]|uniref:hypothetical protein n=1 Tax=Bradyrhizobium sp. CB3481 TaxID=3039158 RepID=UPI0024B13FBD|nr:hypothetical protein [Bradyrhizobium sp. CB3481]WFU20310.1 hypothetical protein QA643_19225 [Bradyrhizobium sp. CB3481]